MPRFFWYLAASIGVLLGAAHHAASIVVLYSAPELGRTSVLAAFLVALATGALVVRACPLIADNIAHLLASSAAATLILGFASPAAFASSVATAVPVVLALSVALSLGACAASSILVFGRVALSLGVVRFWMNPFRLLALGVVLGSAAVACAELGLLREGLFVAGSLAALSTWTAGEYRFIFARNATGTRIALTISHALVLAVAGAIVVAERIAPWQEIASYPDPVVYAADGNRRYVVTSTPSGFEFYVDRQLKVASLDAPRYFEALVDPVMAARPTARRLLLMEGGTGLAEREILRHPSVTSVVVVLSDATLVRLSRSMPWLTKRASSALNDPKIQIVVEEPITWLQRDHGTFDVVIADLPAPLGYLEGKNYTRYFWSRVSNLIDADGVVVVPATSSVQAPAAYSTIHATLSAAGISLAAYHVPIPTLGLWTFLLGSKKAFDVSRLSVSGGRFLNQEGLAIVLQNPPDTRPSEQPPSRLDDQRAVDAFQRERLIAE